MKVLVAGGAGYIGSHCVRQLLAAGHEPIVVDNLVFGHRAAVPASVKFHELDLGDSAALSTIFAMEQIDVVMHFAAYAYVGESVTNPLKYYRNNFAAPLVLLETMLQHGVKKFVFSSTCATFGVPAQLPIVEDTPQAPINPYG
ncbi:MAG: NAD-dependent epimerase/dehydratase family protein, partial [Candidatus Didemnitutus sp.]|nr:NAD-dependent epimerase/dehydratase family protein [Candidatus Didemnitutus sp.]